MDRKSFEQNMCEIEKSIRKMPESQQLELLAKASETRQRYNDIRHSINEASEALGDLRIAIKYAQFDREASARERNM